MPLGVRRYRPWGLRSFLWLRENLIDSFHGFVNNSSGFEVILPDSIISLGILKLTDTESNLFWPLFAVVFNAKDKFPNNNQY